MSRRCRSGLSLVELIVALVLLELTGVLALTAILTSERISRRSTAANHEDVARWQDYHHAESRSECADSGAERAETVILSSNIRPPLEATILCGR